jgi:hypothetical protein
MGAFSEVELEMFRKAQRAGILTDLQKREIVRRQQEFELDPEVDISPIDVPPQFSKPSVKTGGVMRINADPLIEKAAAAGVAFNAPADKGHYLSSFAFDPKNRVEAYKRDLGEKARVRRGSQTGQVEYFNKEVGRFALVNPPGLRLADIEGLAGQATLFGPEYILGASAAFTTKDPFLTSMSSGIGAMLGEISRLKIGQAYGINQDVSDDQIMESALKEGGISFAGGIVAEKIAKFGKFVIDTYNGRILTKKVAETLDMEMHEAQAIADTINDKIDESQIRFNMAQATNDEDLLSMQEALSKDVAHRKEFGEFADEQVRALKEFRNKINSPFRSGMDETATNEKVRKAANDILEDKLTRSNVFVDKKKAELKAASVSIKSRPFESLGEKVREIGSVEQQNFNDWADDAADRLNTVMGNNSFIKPNETSKALDVLSEKAKKSLFTLQRQTGRKLLPSGPPIDTIDIVDSQGNVISSIAPEGLAGMEKLMIPGEKLTFGETWGAISYLKGLTRVSSKGLSTDVPSVGDIKMMTGALERDLRASSQATGHRVDYDEFITKYSAEKRRLDEGLVGKMMERKGSSGRYVIADDQVFIGTFRAGSDAGAKELFNLVKDSPSGLRAVRESIADAYKRTVLKSGRVNADSHERFIEQQQRSMSVFFNKKEMQQIKKPLGIERALRAREESQKKLIDQINKTFESKIANLSPGTLMPFLMDARNPQKAKMLMKMLQAKPKIKGQLSDPGHPGLIRAVQAQFTKEISAKTAGVYRNGERQFSAANFNTFLNGRSGEAGHRVVVKEVMGDQYLQDLDTLNAAIKIVQRESKFPNRSNTAFWADTVKGVVRAQVGLFTRPGRFITAMERIRGKAANQLIVKAMLNPDDMHELMALKGISMESATAIAFIGSMGSSALLKDFSDKVPE